MAQVHSPHVYINLSSLILEVNDDQHQSSLEPDSLEEQGSGKGPNCSVDPVQDQETEDLHEFIYESDAYEDSQALFSEF